MIRNYLPVVIGRDLVLAPDAPDAPDAPEQWRDPCPVEPAPNAPTAPTEPERAACPTTRPAPDAPAPDAPASLEPGRAACSTARQGPNLEPASPPEPERAAGMPPQQLEGTADGGGGEGAKLVPSQQVCGGCVTREGPHLICNNLPVVLGREPDSISDAPDALDAPEHRRAPCSVGPAPDAPTAPTEPERAACSTTRPAPDAGVPTQNEGTADSGGGEGAKLVPSQQVCGGHVYREGVELICNQLPVGIHRKPDHAQDAPVPKPKRAACSVSRQAPAPDAPADSKPGRPSCSTTRIQLPRLERPPTPTTPNQQNQDWGRRHQRGSRKPRSPK